MKIFQIFLLILLLINIQSQQNNATQSNTTNKEVKKEEKPFNLTESLINFFIEAFGANKTNTNNTSNQTVNNEEDIRKKREAEMKKKLEAERDKKRKEEEEKKAKLEKIKMENEKKKKEKKEKLREEEKEFISNILANSSFEEVAQVNLNKGERETLYLDLKGRTKIKIAIMLMDSDVDEKVNFFFTGPNARGHNIVIKQYYSKNFLFWEYETIYPGEYYAEITNKGTKENEILFLFHDDIASEKKDTINNEKIDKISMMLNNIDNNINQLRNKKKIEIKQVNSHNKKVTENNKWIVIYSIIEICTMILVFMMQSCYINSMINKV